MEITVNGEVIPDSLFDQEKDRLHMDPDSPPYDELGEIVKNNLIARALIRQAAARQASAVAATEIDSALSDMIDEAGSEDLFYRRYGITKAQENLVRQEIEVTLKVERFLETIADDDYEPSPEEIKSYYAEHSGDLVRPEEAEAAHIVMNVHCEHEAPGAYEAMRNIRKQLLGGADFAEMAQAHSAAPEDGGNLGRFTRGKMMPEFETIAFSMNPGEISPIFATHFGYHILKMIDRTEEVQLSLEEATPRIESELMQRHREKVIEGWVEATKKEATITTDEES